LGWVDVPLITAHSPAVMAASVAVAHLNSGMQNGLFWKLLVLVRALLQASMPQLIHGSNCTKDIPAMGVLKETLEPDRRTSAW